MNLLAEQCLDFLIVGLLRLVVHTLGILQPRHAVEECPGPANFGISLPEPLQALRQGLGLMHLPLEKLVDRPEEDVHVRGIIDLADVIDSSEELIGDAVALAGVERRFCGMQLFNKPSELAQLDNVREV